MGFEKAIPLRVKLLFTELIQMISFLKGIIKVTTGYKSYSINRWDGTTVSFGIDFGSTSQCSIIMELSIPDSERDRKYVAKKYFLSVFILWVLPDSDCIAKATFAARNGANLILTKS